MLPTGFATSSGNQKVKKAKSTNTNVLKIKQ